MNPSSSYAFRQVAPFVRSASGYHYVAFGLDRPNASEPVRYGCLSIAPTTDFVSSGNQGGPFTPNSLTYTIKNTGGAAFDWTVTKINSWLLVSVPGGNLAPGDSLDIVVTLAAVALTADTYTDSLVFTNLTNGCGDITIPVSLEVINYTPACWLDLSTALIGGTGAPFADSSAAAVALATSTNSCLIAFSTGHYTPTAGMVGSALRVNDQMSFTLGDRSRSIIAKIDSTAGDILSLSYDITSGAAYTLTFKLYASNGTTLLDTKTLTTSSATVAGTLQITAPSTSCFYLRANLTATAGSPTGTLTATYNFTSTGSFATVPILAPYTSGLSTLYLTC